MGRFFSGNSLPSNTLRIADENFGDFRARDPSDSEGSNGLGMDLIHSGAQTASLPKLWRLTRTGSLTLTSCLLCCDCPRCAPTDLSWLQRPVLFFVAPFTELRADNASLAAQVIETAIRATRDFHSSSRSSLSPDSRCTTSVAFLFSEGIFAWTSSRPFSLYLKMTST